MELRKRLARLEARHMELGRPAHIHVAYGGPFMGADGYSVDVPETGQRRYFPTEEALLAWLYKRDPADDMGILLVPRQMSEAEWEAAVAASR